MIFKGCYVALVTPFRDGLVDRKALDELVEHVIAGGVAGVVPCGTTGESPTLSEQEQSDVISAVVRRAKGRVQVIAGTGTNCTEKTLHLSQAAVRAGADAVMLVSPYYNKPNQRGLYEHFSYVARGISVPVVLYNIPGRTGVEIAVDTIARLHADHKNIAAVKHATGSVDGASELAAVSDITILSGDDPLTLPLMSIGATGVISVLGNLLPAEMSSLCNAALAGEWDEARVWHEKLLLIARDLLKLDINPIPIKAALALRGMMAEEYRLPMLPLESAQREKLAALVARYCSSPKARQTA
ncbi:MAG: 4-hydroxy-tetrahydrodipicolinate synthase [Planctomycetota bacterium]